MIISSIYEKEKVATNGEHKIDIRKEHLKRLVIVNFKCGEKKRLS